MSAAEMQGPTAELLRADAWLSDMDGVLVHEQRMIPGADAFVGRLLEKGKRFLLLTNNSIFSARDLALRLRTSGLDVPESAIWTSAMATAQFLAEQAPGGTAFVVGEPGLTTALYEAGFTLTDTDPDYVVLGEVRAYDFTAITKAIRLVEKGARFIATNPDATGPSPEGTLPATGSIAALITAATGRLPYFVGKPNPLMMRSALRRIDAHSEGSIMVGDRMDTDVKSGIEAGMRTVLVMSGITTPDLVRTFPYRPSVAVSNVSDLVDYIE